MGFGIGDLLIAERAGRSIAAENTPNSSQIWQLYIDQGTFGAALAASARWADRFGAKVSVNFAVEAFTDPLVETLGEVCQRLDLVSPLTGKYEIFPNHLMVIGDKSRKTIESFPAPLSAWKTTLKSDAGQLMVKLADRTDVALSCSASREVDRRSIEEFGLPGICLMENAGIGAVSVARDILEKSRSENSTVILTGGGNNGGDGFVVARGLAALGHKVTVGLLKDPGNLTGDAALSYRLMHKCDGVNTVALYGNENALDGLLARADLLVDAMLGTGFSGSVSPAFGNVIRKVNASGVPVLALDLPSGLNGDTGEGGDDVIAAARTVAFANLKTGHLRGSGPEKSGLLYIAEIGAPRPALGHP